ncbi:MAG: hypothetical protein ACKVP3_17505 [Hyphomicrobiaceae bacterium]
MLGVVRMTLHARSFGVFAQSIEPSCSSAMSLEIKNEGRSNLA